MRKLLRSAGVAAALLVLASAWPSAQTVDEIVAKNLAAKGGADRWKAIQSMRLTGSLNAEGQSLNLTIVGKRPNLVRQEVATPSGPVVQAFDGTTAWAINPMTGSSLPQIVTGPQADMIKDQADFDGSLVDYKAKGSTVELVPATRPDDQGFYHLKVTKKGGQAEDLFIDQKTGLDTRSVRTVDQSGHAVMVTSELSNYKQVEGIMVPFTFRQTVNGMPVAEINIQKVEFNVPLDETLFRLPTAKQ